MKNAIILLLFAAMLMVSGCSSIEISRPKGAPLESMKSAYVVVAKGGNPNIGGYIQAALARRGLKVNIGTIEDKPSDAAFFVTYTDQWNWDIVVYLSSLNIKFFDNATGEIIASGSFKNNPVLETIPDPRKKTMEVVDSIYQSKTAN